MHGSRHQRKGSEGKKKVKLLNQIRAKYSVMQDHNYSATASLVLTAPPHLLFKSRPQL